MPKTVNHKGGASGKEPHPSGSPQSAHGRKKQELDELESDDSVFWHGTPSGVIAGGSGGVHVGTRKAARQALEARIGVPSTGEWDGTRQYGTTLLAGRKTLLKKDPRGFLLTGHNSNPPEEDYFSKGDAKYGNGVKVPLDVYPNIIPLKVSGGMQNSPESPVSDEEANERVASRRSSGLGLYYTNIGEDSGSISAVVPGRKHLAPVRDEDKLVVHHTPGGHSHDQSKHGRKNPQTKTAAFKKWFGNSKVVDENGEPLVVYHGTAAEFYAFDNAKTGSNDAGLWGKGHYFSATLSGPNSYALRQGDGARIIPAYVSIKNPLILTTGADLVTLLPDGTNYRDLLGPDLDGSKIKEIAKKGGHDGAIQIKPDGSIGDVVAYDANQIKSATGNRGTFDPNDRDIRNESAPPTKKHGPKRPTVHHTPGGHSHDQSKHGRRNPQTKTAAFKKWFGKSKVVDENGEPLVVYHGTMSEFTEFDSNKGGEFRTLDQQLGSHFANDVDSAESFAFDNSKGWIDPRPDNSVGGNIIPVYLSIQNPRIINQESENTSGEFRLATDAQAINADILDVVMSNDKELFTKWAVKARMIDQDQAGKIFDKLKKGESIEGDEFDSRTHYDARSKYRNTDLTKTAVGSYLENYDSGLHNLRDDHKKVIAAYKRILREQGYDGLRYTNTAPMETKYAPGPVEDKTVWIVFSPEQIKSAIGNRGTFDPNDRDIRNEAATPTKKQRRRNLNPMRLDPTRTTMLRKRWMADFASRFNILKKNIWDLIVVEDAFGLATPNVVRNCKFVSNTRWAFLTSTDRLFNFNNWLKEQTNQWILEQEFGIDVAQSLRPGIGEVLQESRESWLQRYVNEAYSRGVNRAFDNVRSANPESMAEPFNSIFSAGTREEFLRQSFGRPASMDRIKLLGSRAFNDLQGINATMSTQISRELVDGMIRGAGPREVARAINRQVDGIGRARALTLARTETIRAHAEGALDGMENLGVTEIGVAVEWDTVTHTSQPRFDLPTGNPTGNPSPCPLCAPLSGLVLTVDEARGMFPRHPNCRCTPIPANVGESKAGQKRTKARIQAAIRESLRAEIPKYAKKTRTIAEQKRRTRWQGADAKIATVRPKSILD